MQAPRNLLLNKRREKVNRSGKSNNIPKKRMKMEGVGVGVGGAGAEAGGEGGGGGGAVDI